MTPTLQAIAWTLIHFCWQATAVAAAYRLVILAFGRRSSQTRYLIALASLLVMFALAAGTFVWEMQSTPTPLAFENPTQNLHASLVGDFPRSTAPGHLALTTYRDHFTLSALLPWIDGLWLLGVIVLSIRSLGGWWYLRRLRQASITEAPAHVRATFSRICSALGLQRIITLRLSAAIDTPMTMGTLRAIVLLPLSAVTSLGPDELEVVLAHELAHIRRADFFWNVLQTVAETLFFFHPAVWWISACIRHERELCCDDLALQICPNPVVYAHALFRLEQQRSRHLNLAMALDGHQSHQTLLMRVARILGEPMTRIPSRKFRPFSLVAALVGLFALLLPVPHLVASLNPAPHANPAQAAASTSTPAPVQVNPQVVVHIAKPSPTPEVHVAVSYEPTSAPDFESQYDDKSTDSSQPHSSYIDKMKAAGYDVDFDKLVSMKIQNVTPEYARAMANVGLGKPSADELVSCKIQNVTPEYIAQLKQQGLEVKNFQDAVSYRIFNVTPEFAAGMKSAGFDGISSKELLSLRVQGVTPEYARDIKHQYPNATANDVLKTRIFNIDAAFIASAQKHGFNNLSLEKLVQLRISGLLDDESVKK